MNVRCATVARCCTHHLRAHAIFPNICYNSVTAGTNAILTENACTLLGADMPAKNENYTEAMKV